MVDPSFFDAVRLPSTVLLALDNRTFHFAVQPWHYLLRMAHILSTAAFFGGIVLFDLRLIGVRSAAKLKAFSADIMPWLYTIFGIAMVSGVLLFLYDPVSVGSRTYFVPKIILIGLGLVNAALYNRFAYALALMAEVGTPSSAKFAGVLSIAFWVGVVAFSAMNIEGVPTAVHNHLRASPATFYKHVGGHGDPAKMAAVIHDALAVSKTPLVRPAASGPAAAVDLDSAQLDQLIGAKGQANDVVYQFNVSRRDPVAENGMQITPVGPMGVATAINFQPTGGGKAAITGDFVLTNDEVNPVIRALRANAIDVTAVHSHMLDEQPRLFFLHFWANEYALKVAQGTTCGAPQDGEHEELGFPVSTPIGTLVMRILAITPARPASPSIKCA